MKKAFAVYDIKAAHYGTPMFILNRALAIRGFTDAVLKDDTALSQHPGDYSLQEIGEYDECTGKMTSLVQPQFVISAADITAARPRPMTPQDVKGSQIVERIMRDEGQVPA